MDALLTALEADRIDSEMVTFILECLLNITSPELLDNEDAAAENVGEQFTEIVCKRSDNITLFLTIMEEYDFRIRLPVIRLLTNLLVNRPKEIQEILLVSPLGISKIMDLLCDAREVIRNEVF